MLKLDEEINVVKNKLIPFKVYPNYLAKSESLETTLLKEAEQKAKKKFNRDTKDYKDKVVFKWQKEQQKIMKINPQGHL